jgi:hypothetical protein
VAIVLEPVALRAPGRKGQHRVEAVQRLNRRLLVHTENGGVLRWLQVQADHVRRLGLKLRVVAVAM